MTAENQFDRKDEVKQHRSLIALGYRQHDVEHDAVEGGRRIVDARISECGRYVYTLLSDQSALRPAMPIANCGLSNREYTIALLFARGRMPVEIAEELNLSAKTVSTYRERILRKTGLRNNIEIALAFCKRGLVQAPDLVHAEGMSAADAKELRR